MWIIDEQIPVGCAGKFRVKARCISCGQKREVGLYIFNHSMKGRACLACYHAVGHSKQKKEPMREGMVFRELKLRRIAGHREYAQPHSSGGIAKLPVWECECVHCGAVCPFLLPRTNLLKRLKTEKALRSDWHQNWCRLAIP